MTILSILAGICLRFGLLFVPRSFWGDEWESILASRGDISQVILTNVMDVHPPVYFLSLHAAGEAFGWQEWALRLPSLLAGIGALIGIYFFTKEYFDKKTAKASLFFAALSPYLVHLSFELRNHGPVLLFTTWGSFFLLKMLREPENRAWGYSYAASSALAVWTTHFAWFWAAWCAMYLVMYRPRHRSAWVFEGIFSLSVLPILALTIWHSAYEALSWKASSLPSFADIIFLFKSTVSVFWHMITGPQFILTEIPGRKILPILSAQPFLLLHAVGAAVSFTLIVRKARNDAHKSDFRALWLLSGLVLPALFIGTVLPGRLDARYFAFAMVFFCPLLAHSWNKVAAILVLAVSLSGLIFIYRVPTDPFNRENYPDLARYLSENTREGDVSYCKSRLVRYYLDKMNLDCAALLSDDSESRPGTLKNASRVWILEGAEVGTPYFEILCEDLARFGFVPAGKEIHFGERMLINLFERKKS